MRRLAAWTVFSGFCTAYNNKVEEIKIEKISEAHRLLRTLPKLQPVRSALTDALLWNLTYLALGDITDKTVILIIEGDN